MAGNKNKTKNKNKNKNRNRKQRNVGVRSNLSVGHDYECEIKYIHARLDPFSGKAVGACIPFDGVQSFKATYQTRAIITKAAANHFIARVRPTVCYDISTIEFAGGTPSSSTTPSTGSLSVARPIGAPFDAGSLGTGRLEWRVVGAGVKITNITPPVNRVNFMLGYCSPQTTASLDFSFDELSSAANARIMTKPQGELLWDADESDDYLRWDASQIQWTMQFGMPATAFDQTYLVETVSHVEMRGRTVAASSSLSHASTEYTRMFGAVSNTLRSAYSHLPVATERLRLAGQAMYAAGVGAQFVQQVIKGPAAQRRLQF